LGGIGIPNTTNEDEENEFEFENEYENEEEYDIGKRPRKTQCIAFVCYNKTDNKCLHRPKSTGFDFSFLSSVQINVLCA